MEERARDEMGDAKRRKREGAWVVGMGGARR
jgi:hypothetical protein